MTRLQFAVSLLLLLSPHVVSLYYCHWIVITTAASVATGSLTHLWLQTCAACVFYPSYVCSEGEVTLYHYGWKDSATILFYFFIAIILHAVVQEYLLDVSTQSLWHNEVLLYCSYTAGLRYPVRNIYWLFSTGHKRRQHMASWSLK